MKTVLRLCLLWVLIALAPSAWAQEFPKLTGRVVDAANLLDPAREKALTDKLAALEQQSGRQLVVVTIPSLQDYDIADYGYQLGRNWGIGEKDKNTGALLIVAPNERKVRIEVGYGLEGILTDALSSRIIRENVVPYFKANDYPGGIEAGANAIATLLTLPPEEARAQAAAAEQGQKRNRDSGGGFMVIFWIVILLFFVLPAIFGRRGGKRHRRSGMPIVIWGPSVGGSSWGDSGGSGWGGGGFGGGGGFSGGGGSFGGGGASGDW